MSDNELEKITTKELVKELRKREAVKSMDVKPYDTYQIQETGPVIVLVVSD